MVPDEAACSLTPDGLQAHLMSWLYERGDNMLSDQIACCRYALETAICHDDPNVAQAILVGLHDRLDLLVAETAEWEEHAVIVPGQRFGLGSHTGAATDNVVPFPQPNGGDS